MKQFNRDHPLGKTTSRGRPEDIPKRSPMDAPHMASMKGQGMSLANILRKSSTNVLRKLKYEVLRTSQCDVLRMAPHSPICMSWDVPYWCVEDVSCRRYEDVLIWSNIYLQGTCSTDVLRASFRGVLAWFYK